MKVTDEFVEAVEQQLSHGHGAWDMVDPKEICAAVLTVVREPLAMADSELSAIAHGRPPSDKYALLSIAHRLRKLYE